MSYPGPPPQGLGPRPSGRPGKAPDRRRLVELLLERVRVFMVRPRLSCGLRAQLAAVGGFSPQVASSSVVVAWSAFGHASVAPGALAVSVLHSRRGLRPRRGGRRRRRRSPQRGAGYHLWGCSVGSWIPGAEPKRNSGIPWDRGSLGRSPSGIQRSG